MTNPSRPRTLLEAVRVAITIAAPPEDVFHALTDPRELAAWLGGEERGEMFGDDDRFTDDPQAPAAGTTWETPAVAPDGSGGSVGGEYVVVDPPRRLETTWRASWDDAATDHVRFDLVPLEVDGSPGTNLIVTHTQQAVPVHAHDSVVTTGRGDIVASAEAGTMSGRYMGIAAAGEWLCVLARLEDSVTMRAPAVRGITVVDTFSHIMHIGD